MDLTRLLHGRRHSLDGLVVEDERRLVILVNDRVKMSRGKYAAQAVHAALLALGVHPDVPVIVLGGSPDEISQMRTTVHDAGRTEVEPGTLTAGTDWEQAGVAQMAEAQDSKS